MSLIWVLMVVFEEVLFILEGFGSSCLDGVFVEGVNFVFWMVNNLSKLGNIEKDVFYCWIFFSIVVYGKKNKVL